jgi:hypothetical protein
MPQRKLKLIKAGPKRAREREGGRELGQKAYVTSIHLYHHPCSSSSSRHHPSSSSKRNRVAAGSQIYQRRWRTYYVLRSCFAYAERQKETARVTNNRPTRPRRRKPPLKRSSLRAHHRCRRRRHRCRRRRHRCRGSSSKQYVHGWGWYPQRSPSGATSPS